MDKDGVSSEKGIDGDVPGRIIASWFFGNLTGGAALDEGSLPEMEKEFPDVQFCKTPNRNCGLIAVTEREMGENEMWAEGSANIYLDEKLWNFDAFFCEDKEDFISDRGDEYADEFDELTEEAEDIDLGRDFGWAETGKVMELVQNSTCCCSGGMLMEYIG